jgi:hypothetical protein
LGLIAGKSAGMAHWWRTTPCVAAIVCSAMSGAGHLLMPTRGGVRQRLVTETQTLVWCLELDLMIHDIICSESVRPDRIWRKEYVG